MRQSTVESKQRLLRRDQGGFTLVELLIVIAIIAVLATLTTVTVKIVKQRAKVAAVKADIQSFRVALSNYQSDEGIFPGHSLKWDGEDEFFNAFPALFEGVLGQPRSEGGKGGRNAPYWADFKPENVVVMEDEDNPEAGFRDASREEIFDTEVAKFYVDAFGHPYVYRENSTKKRD